MRYAEIQPNLLERALWLYRQHGIVHSQTEFSRTILGCRPAYYSSMQTRHRNPSPKVLRHLLKVTKTMIATWPDNPHFAKDFAQKLNKAFADFEHLAGMINKVLERVEKPQEKVAATVR